MMTKEGIKDGLNNTLSYLWRRVEKMKNTQKTSYPFRFLFVFF